MIASTRLNSWDGPRLQHQNLVHLRQLGRDEREEEKQVTQGMRPRHAFWTFTHHLF